MSGELVSSLGKLFVFFSTGTLLMGGTSASSPDPVVDDDLKSS